MFTIISNFSLQRNSELKWFSSWLKEADGWWLIRGKEGRERNLLCGELVVIKPCFATTHQNNILSLWKRSLAKLSCFSFNDPPIVWFFWSVYKTRNNHTWNLLAQHTLKERGNNAWFENQKCYTSDWKISIALQKLINFHEANLELPSFLIHFKVIIFDFFAFLFLVRRSGGSFVFMSRACTVFFVVNSHKMLFLF